MKKKVRDKVLNNLHTTNQEPVVPNDEIPSSIKRNNTSRLITGPKMRSSSLSVQHTDKRRLFKVEQSTEDSTQMVPSSREEKKRKMKEVYGVLDDIKPVRKLNRASARSSVRSTHSMQTPLTTRKGRHQPAQAIKPIQVMPSLKKQQQVNQVVINAADAAVFDEEQEQL